MQLIRLLSVSFLFSFTSFISYTPVTNDVNDTGEHTTSASVLSDELNPSIKPLITPYSPLIFYQVIFHCLFVEIRLLSRSNGCRKSKRKSNKEIPKPDTKQQQELTEEEKLKKAPTKAPSCMGCEEEAGAAETPKRPTKMKESRGRPRQIDTTNHYCPNEGCEYYGWLNLANIIANGRPNRGKARQLKCKACNRCFMETQGTIFYRKKTSAKTIWQVITALAEGVGLQAASRIFKVKVETISRWLEEASKHAEAVNNYLLNDLELKQVQLDELWSLVGSKEAGETRSARARWVWCAFDAEHKLWLNFVVGDRSEGNAQLLIHGLTLILAPECIPLFTSDGLDAYASALLRHYGEWIKIARKHKKGRSPKPRFCAVAGLRYAQVVKKRIGRRMVSVKQRVVYGTKEAIERALAVSVGNVINTAYIERFNLSLRQHVAALGRKVQSLAKREKGLIAELALFQLYYNFCLPHSSLRKELTTGGNRKWEKQTPGMSAGLTSKVWSLEEVLMKPVPPWRQQGWLG